MEISKPSFPNEPTRFPPVEANADLTPQNSSSASRWTQIGSQIHKVSKFATLDNIAKISFVGCALLGGGYHGFR